MGSPWCWLAGEALGGAPEWVPVHMPGGEVDRAPVEARAGELGQPEVRWPEVFPFDSRRAMLAATFAAQSGRGVAFSLAAMRQAFLGGRDLSVIDNVLIAAAACELHPRAVLGALDRAGVAEALAAVGARAAGLGVLAVPAVVAGGRTWAGTAAIEAAGRA